MSIRRIFPAVKKASGRLVGGKCWNITPCRGYGTCKWVGSKRGTYWMS